MIVPAGKGGCVGAVESFGRGTVTGRGALLAEKWAARCCAAAVLWRLSRVLSASLLARPVLLLKWRWAFGASGLIAPSGRKWAVVRQSVAELRAAPWCGL